MSKFKLKINNGKVTFLLRAGKDLVKNEMAVASAQHIIDSGKPGTTPVSGFPINVDDKWYFEGEPVGKSDTGGSAPADSKEAEKEDEEK